MRWIFLLTLTWIAGISMAAGRPNVVVILTDDQGWGDLSCSGNSNLSTPNIDSLASAGASLERFYVQPLCAPTRAEFLTGRYHPRGGVRGVTAGVERLNVDEKTIGDVFKGAGYRTGAFGKWHNGTQGPYHPNARGFEAFYGFTSGHWGTYFDPPLDHNGEFVTGRGYIVDDLTDRAIEFIESNRQRPFFCYVPYNTPHSPMQVPDRFYAKFAEGELKQRAANAAQEDLAHTRAALAMCENIDFNVGRILAKLEELKLADNTIVVYFHDNGPNGWRWNGGMKGRKGMVDEGGVRSPCFIRWPAAIAAGSRIEPLAGAIDLLPTLADCAGVEINVPKKLDGASLKPLLLGKQTDWPQRMIFAHRMSTSVRTDRYRLDPKGALFDMHADPGQKRDISSSEPAIAAELLRAVRQWREEVVPRGDDDRPFPVGYAELPTAQLPARDGVPHGNVQRSTTAPNCSYFTNWTSAEDRITWDIEVATAGTYEATIYYTCPVSDVGSTIELSLGDARIEGKITDAHDPPLKGMEHDRASRGAESYVKDFKPLRLGTVNLPATRGPLTLRALDIPGKQVMDVRMVLLTLKP